MTSPPDPQQGAGGGPVLRLLSGALQLWLRQQCSRVDSLEIRLQASAGDLLRGRLAGVRVKARGVHYDSLRLELVDLSTGALQIQMGSVWRGRAVQLLDSFAIQGLVSFTAAGLNHSLAQPRWRQLADQLAEELVGITPLVGLRMQGNRLLLAAQGVAQPGPVELEATIQACPGGLQLQTADGSQRSLVPMDSTVRVERATIEAGMLVLVGEATVTP
ncbi:MAG: DUF2993 domain-containing protein [Cyanobacteria bacterium J06638_7]